MPRRARHYLPGMPYHLVQRGNNRQTCFREPGDYLHYISLWRKVCPRYDVFVHAYCLMTNHVHFLLTSSRADGISNSTRVVGSRYAHYINLKYNRTGTLWEGRHRASLVQTVRYLLICQRYVELNPVRARMVNSPEQYPWSSFKENALGFKGWMTPHADFIALGQTEESRRNTYLDLFKGEIARSDLSLIRRATHYCQPTADEAFKAVLKNKYGLKLGQMRRGKPCSS